MIELLVVFVIIAILAAFLIGVSRALVTSGQRNRTSLLIGRIESAVEEYCEKFDRDWLSAIPGPDATAQELRTANRLVTRTLTSIQEFNTTEGMGKLVEVAEDPGSGDQYLVDAWYDPGDDLYDLDTTDGHYTFLNFCRNGFNDPDLDIWSNGPDGRNDSPDERDFSVAGDTVIYEYGDDIVNWGAR